MSNEDISDFDIAILDSIKTIIEVLASKNLASHADFSQALSHQRDATFNAKNANGALVFQMLIDFCNNPERKQVRDLFEKPPQGNA